MPDQVVWTGASGSAYTYYIYPLPVTFNPDQCGNYIYTKIVDQHWVPIYIGEGEFRDRISANHHQAEEITRRAATHVHAHMNPLLLSRTTEESDLLNAFPNAYAPIGCNIRRGG